MNIGSTMPQLIEISQKIGQQQVKNPHLRECYPALKTLQDSTADTLMEILELTISSSSKVADKGIYAEMKYSARHQLDIWSPFNEWWMMRATKRFTSREILASLCLEVLWSIDNIYSGTGWMPRIAARVLALKVQSIDSFRSWRPFPKLK